MEHDEMSLTERGHRVGDLLASGGEMGRLARTVDWAATPIGPVESWPQSLRTAVSICLASRFPMLIWWGPALIQIYNDGYRPVLGAKHPQSMGQRGDECWAEIWDVIGPMYRHVRDTGESTWSEDLLLVMERHGFIEETYFTFSYSAIRDESGGIGGVLVTCVETTDHVIGERRLRTQRELAEQAAYAHTVHAACEAAMATLADNPHDVPFALLYLLDRDGTEATLAESVRVEPGRPESPTRVRLDDPDDDDASWPLAAVARSGHDAVVADLGRRFGGDLTGGSWSMPAAAAVVLRVARPGQTRPAALLVVGATPALPLDASYRAFLDLTASHVATAIANAEAHEEERRRAEALAELDRAKTTFFSNVSHEFRTPLTLLLGPMEEALRTGGDEPVLAGDELRAVHRGALRLLKLVNTLLDFSRIEAGRVRATYEPTALGAFTAELASAFRSAVERAGLRFTIDCPEPAEQAFVDRDMWEKIVLNLLSNAFKFTFDGGIDVRLRTESGAAVLTVRDSGVGVPADELPRLFDRFHRVEGTRARTQEGTGIGLALVQELVRLHGATIEATSAEDAGTTLTVRMPLGHAHLPHERVRFDAGEAARPAGAAPFVEEALQWLPRDAAAAAAVETAAAGPRLGTVLLADDNADMRAYVARLLTDAGWDVVAVGDGRAALARALHDPPDAVVADVMMPELDGFGLLRALRADEKTAELPVILLSARAGEEARVEGMEAGADDYLVKPFAAQELLARVGAHARLARARRDTADRLRDAADEIARLYHAEQDARADAERANRAKGEFLAAMSHELRTPLNAIAGYIDLLEAGIYGPLGERPLAAIDRMRTSQKHLLSLINDILNFAKLESGSVRYDVQDVVLRRVFEDIGAMVEPQLDAQGLAYDVRLPPPDLRVRADRERLQQILLNLLSNAIKFTERGGRIGIDTALPADADGDAVEVRVTDTGCGIPSDRVASIFDPFVQVHRELTRPTEGTGLGLSISRDLARGMGGELHVHSEEGVGSTFTIVLQRAS
jgi:signal transduction histidine kinase